MNLAEASRSRELKFIFMLEQSFETLFFLRLNSNFYELIPLQIEGLKFKRLRKKND